VTPILLQQNHGLKNTFLNGFSGDDIQEFLAACGKSPTLENLSIHPNTDRSYAASLPKFVAVMSRLTDLSISVGNQFSLVEMVKVLKYHRSLEELAVHRGQVARPIVEAELSAFYGALGHNTVLKKVNVWGWPDRFNRDSADDSLRRLNAGIEFYLSLNQMGREQLLEPSTESSEKNRWMMAVADEEDPSNIYNFLRMNPCLCLPQAKLATARANHSSALVLAAPPRLRKLQPDTDEVPTIERQQEAEDHSGGPQSLATMDCEGC